MANKVRLFCEMDGYPHTGRKALTAIESMADAFGVKLPWALMLAPRWKRAVHLFEKLPLKQKKLMVFREPLRVAAHRSRYVPLCRVYGLGKPLWPKAQAKRKPTFTTTVKVPFDPLKRMFVNEEQPTFATATAVPQPRLRP